MGVALDLTLYLGQVTFTIKHYLLLVRVAEGGMH
jgi:hypothetical protein